MLLCQDGDGSNRFEYKRRIFCFDEIHGLSSGVEVVTLLDGDSFFPSINKISPNLLKGGTMNLTISGHHLEVTPSLREYVLTKLDRVTRHFDQVVDVNVLLTVEKQKEKEKRQRAEVTLHAKGKDIFVESSHEDLYAAIDQTMDKLDRQVVRHKDRVQDHHHESHKRTVAGDVA